MIQIKKGDTITATGVKSGSNQNGDWWLCKVNAEKGKDSITLWCPGCTAREGDMLTIAEILEVKKSARQYNEKWYDTFDVTVSFGVTGQDFAELDDDESGDLPF